VSDSERPFDPRAVRSRERPSVSASEFISSRVLLICMMTGISTELSDSLVSTARTGVGDTLRSVVYFTADEFEVLYLRSDLYDDEERAREAKGRLVDVERAGFVDGSAYSSLAADDEEGPRFGEYEFTIRVFRDGFVSRVIVGDHGVLLTTDEMAVTEFEEVAVTLRKLLA
jgi:hypothetical protein